MSNDPVDLDRYRDKAAWRAAKTRRQGLQEFLVDQDALQRRQDELESLLLVAPAETWPEAVTKAQYLIRLFAATPEAQGPRRKQLIAHALDDLTRLCDRAEQPW